MGIRFYCPNGHRLHVKSFLAGKRGICPHCTARFRIPPESEIPKNAPKLRPDSQAAEEKANGKPHAGGVPVLAAGGGAQPLSLAVAPNAGSDPIAENPELVWYVRPPSGGQYGPAKGDVMRQWLAEGRVAPDALVWREGWADWLTAGPVFPALRPAYTAPAATNGRREPVSLQLQPSDDSSTGPRAAAMVARPITHQKSLVPVIILVLTVLVLLVVLVVVLTTKN